MTNLRRAGQKPKRSVDAFGSPTGAPQTPQGPQPENLPGAGQWGHAAHVRRLMGIPDPVRQVAQPVEAQARDKNRESMLGIFEHAGLTMSESNEILTWLQQFHQGDWTRTLKLAEQLSIEKLQQRRYQK